MVSILHNKSICPGTLTDHVHRLISLISSKNVRVVPGPNACVDKNHTVYLPPLPDGATEKDFIKYFHLGTHEQSHIEGNSNFEQFSKDKIKFRIENALEDIRCEQLQEKKLPGLVPYRIKFYHDALNDFANKEMNEATTENIVSFISVLGKYIIVRIRKIQLNADHLIIMANPELLEAYNKHVSDLEHRIINMRTSDEMFELSGIIYDRLKDIIREHIEKQQQKNKPQQGDSNEKGSEGNSGSEDSSDENTPDSSDSNDETDKNKSSGGDSSEKDDDSENNGDPEHDESSSGDDSSSDDNGDDNGDPEDNKPVKGDDNGDNNDDPEDNNNKNRGNGSDPSKDNIPDPDDGNNQDDDTGKTSDDNDPLIDPKEIERELQRIIDDLNNSDDPMDITTEITQQINNLNTNYQSYMVSPDVKDVIKLGVETSDANASIIKKTGLEILGPKGSQITKLFVGQSCTRTAYNQYHGTIDVISYVSDAQDIRDDVHRTVTGPKLDKAAVTFLMDNSSSMKVSIGHMYAILSGLLHYLSKANIPTEAIGYTVDACSSDLWRNAPAYLTIVKQFNEPFSGAAMRRCAPPSTLNYTNDLDGLKFAVPRIWARPERKKIIMILCDGAPYTCNAILTQKLGRSYIEYINLCRKAGIIVFGIGINKDLSKYFGEDFASVNLQNVGAILIDRLTKILNRVRA